MELQDARVTIVGLGLIGGSMALDLRQHAGRLTGVETDPRSAELARRAGIMTLDLEAAAARCDVLVLATPVGEILRLLERFAADPPALKLLIDVGSTKRRITQAMEQLPEHVPALGGHPLCGKELGGFAAAEPGLFDGSPFVLTPCARSDSQALMLAEAVVQALGATPLRMDAERHDRLMAVVSHLPYLLSAALMGSAESVAQNEPDLWSLAATGFLSTSRLAASELTMIADVLSTNRDMALQALSRAQAELEQLHELLAGLDDDSLRQHLAPLQQRRVSLAIAAGDGDGT